MFYDPDTKIPIDGPNTGGTSTYKLDIFVSLDGM